jgi:valyl-tRNA synthetase
MTHSPFYVCVVLSFATIYVDLQGTMDIHSVALQKKKGLETLDKQVDKLLVQLNNPAFLSNAPEEVVQKVESKWLELLDQRNKTLEYLLSLAGS